MFTFEREKGREREGERMSGEGAEGKGIEDLMQALH